MEGCMQGPSVLGKRKAHSMDMPSMSGASGASYRSFGATATSGSAGPRKQVVCTSDDLHAHVTSRTHARCCSAAAGHGNPWIADSEHL